MDEQRVDLFVERTETGYRVSLVIHAFEKEEDAMQQGHELLAFIEGWEGETLH